MGYFDKDNDTLVYRQTDGRITARFHDWQEKEELAHSGSSVYRWVLYSLMVAGSLYLGYLLVHFGG
jgi:hypothetical protein